MTGKDVRDVHDLAEKMFEAAESERYRVDGKSERWTEVDWSARDRWTAAARVAWKLIGAARLETETATAALVTTKAKLRSAVDVALNIEGPAIADRDEYRGHLNELRAFGEP